MKNYLYILCAFLLAFAGCTKDADVEPIAPAPDGNTQVVLTGFSGRGTRTGFGGAEDGAVPFLWSAGDYIWARNTRSEAIAEGGSQATFVFESLETADTYDVFYNLTGPAAATALIPAEQTQQAAGELNLGQNGDFGYATAQNGTFTLEHATSYVWFDTYSSDVTSNLLSITLSVSGGQTRSRFRRRKAGRLQRLFVRHPVVRRRGCRPAFAEQRYRRVRRHGALPRRSFDGHGFDRL